MGKALSSEGSFLGTTAKQPHLLHHSNSSRASLVTHTSLGTHSQHPQLQGLFLLPIPIPFKAVVFIQKWFYILGSIWQCLKTFLIVMTQE